VATHASAVGLDDNARALLQRMHWGGNVRELFNVIERAFPFASGRRLTAADLAAPIAPADALPIAIGSHPPAASVAEHERVLIEHTLLHHHGNKAGAARQLGISRKRLYARLAKYGL